LSDKTFTIALANDTGVEPDETLVVALSNVAGGATLDGPSSLTVTIVNDDAVASTGGDDGGGGVMDLLFLAFLALLAARRKQATEGAASAATS
jgi:hypothetical protein